MPHHSARRRRRDDCRGQRSGHHTVVLGWVFPPCGRYPRETAIRSALRAHGTRIETDSSSGRAPGILILEEYDRAVLRGAKPLAELVGYAANSDAYHTNAPPEDGRGIRRVMQLALCDAGLRPDQIGYLNAHATSTPLGDRAEAAAIRTAFGKDAATLRVSSTKSMTGHLLGAAGSLEAGITVLAVRDQIAPPTTNVSEMEEELGFDLIVECRFTGGDGVRDVEFIRIRRDERIPDLPQISVSRGDVPCDPGYADGSRKYHCQGGP